MIIDPVEIQAKINHVLPLVGGLLPDQAAAWSLIDETMGGTADYKHEGIGLRLYNIYGTGPVIAWRYWPEAGRLSAWIHRTLTEALNQVIDELREPSHLQHMAAIEAHVADVRAGRQ